MFRNQDLMILEEDLKHYKPLLRRIADTILEHDVSAYPIFVLHQDAIEVGVVLNTDNIGGAWKVNASSLEEFVKKQIILPEKLKDFKSVYKDPAAFLCLFVIDKSGATFVFVPRNGQ